MTNHTPTPWRVCDSHPQRAAIYIKPGEGWGEVAALYGGGDDHEAKDENGVWRNDGIRMANAAFIVKSANHFDALVKALEECAIRCRYDGDLFHDQGNEMRRDASWRAADLANATLASIKDESA